MHEGIVGDGARSHKREESRCIVVDEDKVGERHSICEQNEKGICDDDSWVDRKGREIVVVVVEDRPFVP